MKQSDEEEKYGVNYGTLSMAQEYAKNDHIGDTTFEVLDITDKDVAMVADCVVEWVKKNC